MRSGKLTAFTLSLFLNICSILSINVLNIGILSHFLLPPNETDNALAQIKHYVGAHTTISEQDYVITSGRRTVFNWDIFNVRRGLEKIDFAPGSFVTTSRSIYVLLLEKCQLCHAVTDLISELESSYLWTRKIIAVCLPTYHPANLKPCRDELEEQRAMKSLLDNLALKNIVVFYDIEIDPGLSQVIKEISEKFFSVVFVDINKTMVQKEFGSFFANNNQLHNFIISTKLDIAVEFLKKTDQINLLGPEYNWLIDMRHDITGSGEDKLKQYMNDGDNTAVVTTYRSSSGAPSVSYRYQLDYYLEDTLTSLLSTRNTDDLNIQQTKIVLSVKKCLTSCAAPFSLTTVAEVDTFGNLTIKESDIFPAVFQGFNNRLFKVITKHHPPFVVKKKNNGTVEYSGLCIALLNIFAERLNFRYTIGDSRDNKFGVKEESDIWNGMIGDIHHKVADFAAAGLTINSRREEVVDFTFPYFEEPSTVLIRQGPSDSLTVILWIFKPLRWSTWLLALVVIIFVALLVLSFTYASLRITKLSDPMTSYGVTFWYCAGAFLQQGGFKEPMCFAGRVIAGCWWFMIIVIYAIYTGNLIAFLTVSKDSLPFNTLEQMSRQTEYTYGLEDGIIHMQLFRESTGGIYQKIWQEIHRDKRLIVDGLEAGIHKVKTEKYGLIGEKTAFLPYTEHDCSLRFIREEFFKSGFGFAMPEGWPYTKYFNRIIMSLVETGFIDHWKLKYWPKNRCDVIGTKVNAKAITLEEISGSFYILFCGMTISICVLLVERCVTWNRSLSISKRATTSRESTVSSASYLHEVTHNSSVHILSVYSQGNLIERASNNQLKEIEEMETEEIHTQTLDKLNNEVSVTSGKEDNNSIRQRNRSVKINRNDWRRQLKQNKPNETLDTELAVDPQHIREEVSIFSKDVNVHGINEHIV